MKRFVSLLLLVGIVVFLAWSINLIVELRFDRGDVYPAYSSLRKDPVGTGVLFEAIDDLDGQSVRRNFDPLNRQASRQPSTWLFLGLHAQALQSPILQDQFEELLRQGHRVVVSLVGYRSEPEELQPFEFEPSEEDSASEEETNEEQGSESEASRSEDSESVYPHWDFEIEYSDAFDSLEQDQTLSAIRALDRPGLPEQIKWTSSLIFPPRVEEHWTPLYRLEGEIVAMERHQGQGSVVILTDTYLLSNEGLSLSRQPSFLIELLGNRSHFIIDEIHLGTTEHTGVIDLVYRYGLHGFVLGLIFLAALCWWWALFPLVPKRADYPQDRAAQGLGTETTLLHLLQQTIPSHRILKISVKAWWEEVHDRLPEDVPDRLAPLTDQEPLRGYREISKIIQQFRLPKSR